MDFQEFLASILVNISTTIIWENLKKIIKPNQTKEELVNELSNCTELKLTKITAEKIIDFLIRDGKLLMKNSYIYSNEGIHYVTTNKSSLEFTNSTSNTKNTSIVASENGIIKMSGDARIIQSDGSIEISVGKINKYFE